MKSNFLKKIILEELHKILEQESGKYTVYMDFEIPRSYGWKHNYNPQKSTELNAPISGQKKLSKEDIDSWKADVKSFLEDVGCSEVNWNKGGQGYSIECSADSNTILQLWESYDQLKEEGCHEASARNNSEKFGNEKSDITLWNWKRKNSEENVKQFLGME